MQKGPKFSFSENGKIQGPQTISHYVKLKSADNNLETAKLKPYGSKNTINSSTSGITRPNSSSYQSTSSTKSTPGPHTSHIFYKDKRKTWKIDRWSTCESSKSFSLLSFFSFWFGLTPSFFMGLSDSQKSLNIK